jgi:hypothetical protein
MALTGNKFDPNSDVPDLTGRASISKGIPKGLD